MQINPINIPNKQMLMNKNTTQFNSSNFGMDTYNFDSVSFKSCLKASKKSRKALLLTLMAIISSGSIMGNGIFKTENQKTGLYAEEIKPKTNENEISTRLNKIIKDKSGEFSFYRYTDDKTTAQVDSRKLEDYTRLVNSIPLNIKTKGQDEILKYQNSILDILQRFDELGAMYVDNIPDKENMSIHAQGLMRLADAVSKNQGCEFKNCALINGLSADELITKVVIPNEKIANGEKIGQNQKTLLFMSSDDSFGLLNGFEWNLAKNSFTGTSDELENYKFEFEKSFLGNYDNIILMQPKNKSADETLDNFFESLTKGLEKGASIDLAFIGHGTNKIGVTLSRRLGQKLEKSMMDESDFRPLEKGGNDYAQKMKELFQNAIDNGHKPKVIGIGCSSEFMQNCMNEVINPQYINNIKVFGTPYKTNGNYVLGYSNDKLEIIFLVSVIKDNFGLIVELTDVETTRENNKNVTSFTINPEKNINMDIMDNYFNKKTTTGVLTKPSGVSMHYRIKDYNPQ